jgi:hypothetical protein
MVGFRSSVGVSFEFVDFPGIDEKKRKNENENVFGLREIVQVNIRISMRQDGC